jgi:hypothetical protein
MNGEGVDGNMYDAPILLVTFFMMGEEGNSLLLVGLQVW